MTTNNIDNDLYEHDESEENLAEEVEIQRLKTLQAVAEAEKAFADAAKECAVAAGKNADAVLEGFKAVGKNADALKATAVGVGKYADAAGDGFEAVGKTADASIAAANASKESLVAAANVAEKAIDAMVTTTTANATVASPSQHPFVQRESTFSSPAADYYPSDAPRTLSPRYQSYEMEPPAPLVYRQLRFGDNFSNNLRDNYEEALHEAPHFRPHAPVGDSLHTPHRGHRSMQVPHTAPHRLSYYMYSPRIRYPMSEADAEQITADIETLQETVEQLEGERAELNAKTVLQEKTIERQEKEIRQLQVANEEKHSENEDLKERNDELEEAVVFSGEAQVVAELKVEELERRLKKKRCSSIYEDGNEEENDDVPPPKKRKQDK